MGASVSILANKAINPVLHGIIMPVVDSYFFSELSEDSRCFLHLLWKNAPNHLEQLINKLNAQHFILTASHVATILEQLEQEQRLPENILRVLADYLEMRPLIQEGNERITETEQIIKGLFVQHGPGLLESANNLNHCHHSLPHAFEIFMRVNKVMEHLGLLTHDEPINRFLRSIITLSIQFHDLIQKSPQQKTIEKELKGECLSAEEESAERVIRWIVASLDIASQPELVMLINFIVNRIIVLGTTVIFNKPPTVDCMVTMDLSQLFLEFKQVAVEAGLSEAYALPDDLSVTPLTKAALMHSIDVIMLVTGVCDKNPASLECIVMNEVDSIIPLMKAHFQTPLLFEIFFESEHFISPYPEETRAFNYQAFLKALIPHVCMRGEFSAAKGEKEAIECIQFINLSRKLKQNMRHQEFSVWFNQASCAHEMKENVSTFFFQQIEQEAHFCRSQIAGVRFTLDRLRGLPFSGCSPENIQRLINPNVPEIDAKNLIAFKNFYFNSHEQVRLISELLFAVTIQMGEQAAVESGIKADLINHRAMTSMYKNNALFFYTEQKQNEVLPYFIPSEARDLARL